MTITFTSTRSAGIFTTNFLTAPVVSSRLDASVTVKAVGSLKVVLELTTVKAWLLVLSWIGVDPLPTPL